jgi:NTE family protein
MVSHLPEHVEPESGWRHIDVLPIAPSERIEIMAARHLKQLPLSVRGLLGAVGGNRAAGASFASYLLFEAEFAAELIDLGFQDALSQRTKLAEWIGETLLEDEVTSFSAASGEAREAAPRDAALPGDG